ncbi:2,3-diaminopropionate biosynthesis protein SbnA [Streptomyces sp. NPDC006602]|uniref:2,3-diaminopropionate biosynthesis protein SbnA n=1 Tax=Streptomyces sp. NPDC006602 TaxID=3364751 RepID=UPI0036D141E3
MIFEQAHEVILDQVFLRLSDLMPNLDVYLKLEGLNPAGSIKLKTASAMVGDAEEKGMIQPGCHIIESSSGSLGIALAMVCTTKGYGFTCVTDPNTSRLSIQVIRALGGQVVEINQRDPLGGYLGNRIAYIERRLVQEPDLVWLNQYGNPANPAVHARQTATAITAEIPDIDALFVGAGTTGTLMGCVQHFRSASPATKIIAVDSEGSVTFGHPAGPRHIPGIGTSSRPPLLRSGVVDDVLLIPEVETVRTCRLLARRHGLVVGGSTGSVVTAIMRYAPQLPEGARVVAVSPDFGDRYAHTIYDDDWVADRLGVSAASLSPSDQPELSAVRR